MEATDPHVPRIVHVANRILADIRRRRLKPGDAYLTTAEAARLLGVSTTLANRAMQLLVQRHVLDRRQRRGTTVAEPPRGTALSSLRHIHVLVNRQHIQKEGLLTDGRLIGIQSALPGVDIGYHFLPEGDEAAEIDRLVRAVLAAHEPVGLILLRAPLEAQRALAASGLPAVLSGTPYPSVHGLVSMDRDNRQVGRLMAGYLLKQRVAHVAVLLRDRLTQGDHLVADAVRDTLAEAGLPLTALTIRGLPSDAKAAVAEIGVLLDTCPKPIGLLCRGLPLAQAAEAAFQARDLPANKRPTLAVCDLFGEASRNPLYPHARPMLSPQQWGKRLGQLLACQVRGERPEADHELVPVELALP